MPAQYGVGQFSGIKKYIDTKFQTTDLFRIYKSDINILVINS